jgi:hypothetical protein
MNNANLQELGLQAKLVIVFATLFIVAGVLWHGVTFETVRRIWTNLIERPSGPMSFRFLLQPAMATIAAVHDGLQDARTGRSPYFWAVLHEPTKRIAQLNEGLNATARIILLGLAVDVIYQVIVFKTFFPVEALIVALLLAFLPYLIIRGLVMRAWRSRIAPTAHD